MEAPEPTTLMLFRGELTNENTMGLFGSAVGHESENMGYRQGANTDVSQMGMLWSGFVFAQPMRTEDGGTCRMVPIPRPLDLVGSYYFLRSVRDSASAFRPGLYTGQMYLTLSNPKWVPCFSDGLFDPCKGVCTAEFGLCNLRHLQPPQETLGEGLTPSFVSRWVSEFRTVFQC